MLDEKACLHVRFSGADLEGGVRGVRPPFCAYVPVYILQSSIVFCNDNGSSYVTSVTKTRFLQLQLGMLSGRQRQVNENCEKYKVD